LTQGVPNDPARREEQCRKIREALQGRPCSEETRRKISEAARGRRPSEETRRRMSESQKRRPHPRGLLSEEARRNISEAQKGKHHSEEARHRMSVSQKGRKHPEEVRRKISEGNRGKRLKEETKKKLSEAAHRRFENPENRMKIGMENNYAWKGDAVGYKTLHEWIRKYKPIPQTGCEHCHKNKPLHAANISGEYRRDVNDYIWLCGSCHKKFDIENKTHCQNLLVTLQVLS